MSENTTTNNNILLDVKDLKKHFPIYGGIFSKEVGSVKAVDGVSFNVKQGEVMGLVGESGCGKSTTGRTILRLMEPTAGEAYFEGKNIFNLNKTDLRNLRRAMQIIFQDPYASLNPRMVIGDIIGEAMLIHNLYSNASERRDKVVELLEQVGLSSLHLKRYPHEFSGGQRQRIGIARALAVQPKLIIADEPVSALDVSIQAQVINLMQQLKAKYGLTYIFIAHDLSVVQHISDRIVVMYLGLIAEIAPANKLYTTPFHPYSQALLSAVPIPDPDKKSKRIKLEGDVPNPINRPEGCPFHPRCNKVKDICKRERPILKEVSKEHFAACHLV